MTMSVSDGTGDVSITTGISETDVSGEISITTGSAFEDLVGGLTLRTSDGGSQMGGIISNLVIVV